MDFHIKNGWIFPWQNVNVHQRVYKKYHKSYHILLCLGVHYFQTHPNKSQRKRMMNIIVDPAHLRRVWTTTISSSNGSRCGDLWGESLPFIDQFSFLASLCKPCKWLEFLSVPMSTFVSENGLQQQVDGNSMETWGSTIEFRGTIWRLSLIFLGRLGLRVDPNMFQLRSSSSRNSMGTWQRWRHWQPHRKRERNSWSWAKR